MNNKELLIYNTETNSLFSVTGPYSRYNYECVYTCPVTSCPVHLDIETLEFETWLSLGIFIVIGEV